LVRSGIEGLDERLGGGLPDQSLILVVGGPGSWFDILVQQILYYQASEEGRVVKYLTIERTPDEVEEDMSLFGWDLSDLKREKKWRFVDARSMLRRRKMLVEDVLALLGVTKGAWSAVDSLTYLFFLYEPNEVVRAVDSFKEEVKAKGGTHFILLGRGVHNPEVAEAIAHLTDGVLEVISRESAQEVIRLLRIRKMRRVFHDTRLLPLRLSRRGLAVETVTRVL
jgi:KaiC/GvpD/RAD55 family RecA-like ATPase